MYFPAMNVLKDRFQLRKSTIFRITLDHLVLGLEARLGYYINTETLVRGQLSGDQRGVGSERVVDTRIGNKIGLELVEVHVESSVEPEASRDRRDDLCNEPVEVGVGRSLNR